MPNPVEPPRDMFFIEMEAPGGAHSSPCFVCISHKLHRDGYLYREWQGVREKFHRFIYRAHNGEDSLPKGFEVDHVCWNKACCNPRHLRALTRRDHMDYTNRMRGEELRERARLHWEAYGRKVTSVELGPLFGRSQQAASDWIRAWRAEEGNL